jgi:hypothetical protein
MNAIIFYTFPVLRLTGSVINIAEYFLQGYENNQNLKLVILNGTNEIKRKFLNIIRDRYILKGIEGFESNIINIKRSSIIKEKFDTVLIVDYNTIRQTRGVLNTKKIIVISEKYTEIPDYFYNKSLYNVTYYGEMPFHYKDVDYKMKCLFNRFKPIVNEQVGTYINSPKNKNFDFLSNIKNLPQPFIIKSKIKPEEKLFEKFSHFLYYHANKWFDPHPRLFLECKFYKKKITYINKYNIKDGSYYRYKDIQENGLKNRTLSKNDEIIRQLI